MLGPRVAVCDDMHAEKYRLPGETFEGAMTRIADGLSDNGVHRKFFRDILMEQRFMPAGRIQVAIGAPRATTPYNCFVGGTIADSFVSGEGNIMQRATETAATMRLGGGMGNDFSTLRPRGALIKSLNSQSTGPISFMSIFNGIGDCTASVGDRRGAQMGVLRVDHPDIEEFVEAKQNNDKLRRFNISVGVTDEFMDALARKSTFQLRWGGTVYKTVDAEELWEKIMRSTWDWAEPGVLFIDAINNRNNLWYCEQIAATNPCAEQPLPPNGACLLGSFNLAKYVFGSAFGFSFDYAQLIYDIPHVVRAMDNVVDVAQYPLPAQEAEAKNKRRMGLGVTGLANALEACGHPYGSAQFVAVTTRILEIIRDGCYSASIRLGMEKGKFPLCDNERYAEGHFIKTLSGDLQTDIRRHGIRNSHLLSIAPTGTISFTADNVSSSIEPVFAKETVRPVQTSEGEKIFTLKDYGWDRFGVNPRTTDDVTIDEHVDILCASAVLVDSAVSKTCNVNGDTPWEDFKGVYLKAYEGGAKGCTTFNKDGKRFALLTAKKDEPEAEFCTIDENGQRSCA